MSISSAAVEQAVEAGIARITQPELIACIRQHRVPVRCEPREWDYGAAGLTYPCWIFAEHPASNIAFAYCEQGFGPSNPWGLLFIRGEHLSIGMDCGWFARLEDLFRESSAWDGDNPPGYEVG
jgi:hypothetical protein